MARDATLCSTVTGNMPGEWESEKFAFDLSLIALRRVAGWDARSRCANRDAPRFSEKEEKKEKEAS